MKLRFTINASPRFPLFAILLCLSAGLAQTPPPNAGPPTSQVQNEANLLINNRGKSEADRFTGSFGYSVPIEAAPARGGYQPPVTLRYSSSGDNGWVGQGWNLDIGYIERNTKDGFPIQWDTSTPPQPVKKYDSTKGFILNLFGKQAKLLPVASEYRAEVDTDFFRCVFDQANNRWEVYDTSGTVYRFGYYAGTANSRLDNPNSGWTADHTRSFRWALDEIITPSGDRTTITYQLSTTVGNPGTDRVLYPNLISYNGHVANWKGNGYHGNQSPTHTIQFTLQPRNDSRVSYRSGFRVVQDRRISEIFCKVIAPTTQNVRRYALEYEESPSTKRSLLKRVRTFTYGNGNGSPVELPVLTFAYQDKPVSPTTFFAPSTVKWNNLKLVSTVDLSYRNLTGRGAFSQTLTDLVDIDGDGLPDRVRWDWSVTPNRYMIQRNLGIAGTEGSFSTTEYAFGPVSYTHIPANFYQWSVLNSSRLRFMDIDGDGRPDRVADDWDYYADGTPLYSHFAVQKNTGKGFTTDASTIWPVDTQSSYVNYAVDTGYSSGLGWRTTLSDINGDGIPDRIMMKVAAPWDYFVVQFGTGSGFGSPRRFPYSSQGRTSAMPWSSIGSDWVHMTDINGDGLPDRVMLELASPGQDFPISEGARTRFVVEFNNGYGFEQGYWNGVQPQYVQDTAGIYHPEYAYVQRFPDVGLVDMNGDGLPDRVMPKEADANKTTWLVQFNTGTSFAAAVEIQNIDIQKKSYNANNTKEHWFGIHGVGSINGEPYQNQTITAVMDMNGDGLMDRVIADYDSVASVMTGVNGHPWIWVQMNAGPFPDLMKQIENGIGGITTVTYKSSTAYDNRQDPADPDSGKLLPFPIQTVATITENDGVNVPRTTTYGYEGGFYDGTRREFAGFAKVTETDPSNRKVISYFHQGGGQERAALGEYKDKETDGTGNFAKRGMVYRTESYGTDNQVFHVSINQVDQADLGNGRRFPFVANSLSFDYPVGSSAFKTTAERFEYDQNTGNLKKNVIYGEVSGVNPNSVSYPLSLTDTVAADTQFHHLFYATIVGNSDIKDHPDSIRLTSDEAGSAAATLQERKFTYNSPSGTIATEQTRICPGEYSVVSYDEYDSYGLVTRTTDAAGVQTKIDSFDSTQIYPAVTRRRVNPPGNSSGDHITSTTYDLRSGLLTYATDPMNINMENTYDGFFRLIKVQKGTTPGGAATALTVKLIDYNLGGMTAGNSANSVRVRIQDGSGADATSGLESWTYCDGFGRIIQTKTEAEESGKFRAINTVYNERGDAYLTTWPRIESGSGFTKPSTSSAQPAAFTGYDAAGRINLTRERVDATFTFNGSGIQSVSVNSNVAGDANSPLAPKQWGYTFNNDPWWIVCTDEDLQVRRYRIDGFGRTNRIEEVADTAVHVTTLNYDRVGNLTEIINANLERIHFAYDDAGGLVAMADPHLGQWTYKRDRAGRVREQVDAKKQKVEFEYNASLSRLSAKRVYSPASEILSTTTYTYDTSDDAVNYPVHKGLLYKITDDAGWEKNGYDGRGRVSKTTRHLSINGQNYTTQRSYNDGDKITSTVYPNSGPTINYTYHYSGALNKVSRTGYDYYTANAGDFDEFGRAKVFTYGNGKTTTRTYYDKSRRLHTIGVPSVFSKEYRYTAADDVTYINGTGMGSAATVTYDKLHRVKTYSALSGSYVYDAVGNISASIEAGGGASTYNYATVRPQAVRTAFGKTYLYDKCGNMIVRRGDTTGSQTLEYDGENRLARVAQAGSFLVEFGYSGEGQRLWKLKNKVDLQIWIGSLYEEKDGKTLFHVFAGDQRICTFEPGSALAVNGGGGYSTHVAFYYHQDHLTSSSVLSDSGGVSREINVWYPFGRIQSESLATFKVSNRFTGQVRDEETGLYYYSARYYDPELGRFIQPDTIIPDLGNPQSYNRYAYCINNPLKYVDPTGHGPKEVLDSIGNFGGGVVIGVANILHPVPVQLRPSLDPPSTMAEYYGRKVGEALGVGVSLAEIYGGGVTIGVGGGLLGGGAVAEGATLGAATPVAVPAMIGGGGVMIVGGAFVTHGAIGVNNFLFSKTSKPPPPNQGNAKPHGGKDHDAAIDDRVKELRKDPSVSNIRKNQQQVDVKGKKVGDNRPDLQYDKKAGNTTTHHNEEWDRTQERSNQHRKVIEKNDSSSKNEYHILP